MFALVTNNTGYTFRRHRDAQFAELGGKGGELTYRGREQKEREGKRERALSLPGQLCGDSGLRHSCAEVEITPLELLRGHPLSWDMRSAVIFGL